MKVRALRKILDGTKYIISAQKDRLCIGSQMVSDLLWLDTKTMHIKASLDTFNEGKASLNQPYRKKLLSIWNKLDELIESGAIKNILEGEDEIENPLTVYSYSKGQIIESTTDEYGFPNTTSDGTLMYDNSHFKTKEQAISSGLEEARLSIRHHERRIKELKIEIAKEQNYLSAYSYYEKKLKAIDPKEKKR